MVRWYSEGDPGKVLGERLALNPRDLEFQGRRFSQIINTSEGSGTPRAPSMNLLHIIQQGERVPIPQRYKVDTVVSEGAQGVLDRLFLTASLSSHRDENPGVFAGESAGSPESTGRVPKRLPLSGEVAETSGDAEEESIIGGEDLGRDYWVVWFFRSTHLPQHLLGEGFWNSGKMKLWFVGGREREDVGTLTGRLLCCRPQTRRLSLWLLRLEVIRAKVNRKLREKCNAVLELTGANMTVHCVDDDCRPQALESQSCRHFGYRQVG